MKKAPTIFGIITDKCKFKDSMKLDNILKIIVLWKNLLMINSNKNNVNNYELMVNNCNKIFRNSKVIDLKFVVGKTEKENLSVNVVTFRNSLIRND